MNILLLALLGGILGRWHGGGFQGWTPHPKIVKDVYWATVPATLAALTVLDATQNVWLGLAALVVAGALCSLGIATGNSRFRDLGTFKGTPRTVKLEFIIKWLHGRIPEYWYDVLGLSVIGFAAVSGFVVTVAWVDPVAAGIVAVGGLLKPVGYCVGLALAKRGWVFTDRNYNVLGEFVAGALAYGAMGLATTVGG